MGAVLCYWMDADIDKKYTNKTHHHTSIMQNFIERKYISSKSVSLNVTFLFSKRKELSYLYYFLKEVVKYFQFENKL